MAARKYGNADTYKKVRELKAHIRRLENSGVVRKGSTEKITVSKTGIVKPTRSVAQALADFNAAISGKARIHKLTPDQAKKLKASYSHLPEYQRPTIKNNRVLVGSGYSLRTSGGDPRIEATSSSRRFKNTFFLKDGWESDVRKIMERNPGRYFYFEFNNDIGGNPQLTQEGWPATPRGINDMIKFIHGRYVQDKGVSGHNLRGRLVMQESVLQQAVERDANMKRKAAARKQKQRAAKKAEQAEAERKAQQAADKRRYRIRKKRPEGK